MATVILSPAAPAQHSVSGAAKLALGQLQGKVVGFIDNAKPNFNHLVDDMAALLTTRCGVARVVRQRKRSASIPVETGVLEALARECDLVITGSGD
jgi:hypothetical protein